MGERELIGEVRTYLGEQFPGREIDEEWDRSRDVLVFRIPPLETDGRTYLVEVASDLLDRVSSREIPALLDRWGAAGAVREHFRILLTPQGLEPLPWKQIAPRHDRLEEALEESFPASDAPGLSPMTPGKTDSSC